MINFPSGSFLWSGSFYHMYLWKQQWSSFYTSFWFQYEMTFCEWTIVWQYQSTRSYCSFSQQVYRLDLHLIMRDMMHQKQNSRVQFMNCHSRLLSMGQNFGLYWSSVFLVALCYVSDKIYMSQTLQLGFAINNILLVFRISI